MQGLIVNNIFYFIDESGRKKFDIKNLYNVLYSPTNDLKSSPYISQSGKIKREIKKQTLKDTEEWLIK